jgi:hypothetical protein
MVRLSPDAVRDAETVAAALRHSTSIELSKSAGTVSAVSRMADGSQSDRASTVYPGFDQDQTQWGFTSQYACHR